MAEEVEYPLDVEYCGICSLPPEYCEYGPDSEKCKNWLKDNIPDLYEELVGKIEGLSVEDGEGEKKKRQTRGGKANKLARKKTAEKKIIINRELTQVERWHFQAN